MSVLPLESTYGEYTFKNGQRSAGYAVCVMKRNQHHEILLVEDIPLCLKYIIKVK